jgi:dipeptidyl aminopeptidase/acylaminoacyl peptidase
MTRLFFAITALVIVVAHVHAADPVAAKHNADPIWEIIPSAHVTQDGKWFAYVLESIQDGATVDAAVVVRNTDSGLERRYAVGPVQSSDRSLALAPSGRWMAFLTAARATSQDAGLQFATTIVELATGKRLDFAGAREFSFAQFPAEVILLRVCNTATVSECVLVRHSLDSHAAETLGAADDFALNPTTTRVAWAASRVLHVRNPADVRRRFTVDDGCTLKDLTWSKAGSSLAAFQVCGDETSLLTWQSVDEAASLPKVRRVTDWHGFPPGFEIATGNSYSADLRTRSALSWRDDKGIFFSVRPRHSRADVRQPNESATVQLWNSRDPKLPAQKKIDADLARLMPDLGYLSLPESRFVQIEAGEIRSADIADHGGRLLVYDPSPYVRPEDPNIAATHRTSQRRDYYIVDVRTGVRERILTNLVVLLFQRSAALPQLSPDGSFVVYHENGDYKSLRLDTGAQRNLTAGLPTKFYFDENRRNARQLREAYWLTGSPLQGWSEAGAQVLLSDYYDIWALPLAGGTAINLTRGGPGGNTSFELDADGVLVGSVTVDTSRIDLASAIHFRVTNLATGETGLARRLAGSDRARVDRWYPAIVQHFHTRNQSKSFCLLMNAAQGPDYYVAGADEHCTRRLTQANASYLGKHGPSVSRLLSYTTSHGDKLHAVLHLPPDYVSGRRYPTIVSIYEQQAGLFHVVPAPGTETFEWLQHGYAVLLPDILPRVNAPGPAAVEGTLAAVDAAIASGLVDGERLGLFGHSHGGYETYFVVTQTDRFKAAVPYAGQSDLLSAYGGVYGRLGAPSSHGIEHEQPQFEGPWWEHWDAYIENSPIFHAARIKTPLLIAHGDRDELVPFTQAVEMFNTLRRMGKADVVLLEYEGSDHALVGEAKRDFQQRVLQFFDHYLLGSPAPPWWTQGVAVSADHERR